MTIRHNTCVLTNQICISNMQRSLIQLCLVLANHPVLAFIPSFFIFCHSYYFMHSSLHDSHPLFSVLYVCVMKEKTGTWALLSVTMSSYGRSILPTCPRCLMRAVTTSSQSAAAPPSTSTSWSNACRDRRRALRVWKRVTLPLSNVDDDRINSNDDEEVDYTVIVFMLLMIKTLMMTMIVKI